MTPSEIRRLTEEALDALHSGNPILAVALADQIAAAAPDDPVAYIIRTHGLLRSDAGLEALDEARRAAELDPTNPDTQFLLAIAAWRFERYTLTQQCLEQAIELSDRRPTLLAEYAWFMAFIRGPRLAHQAATEAVEANPQSPLAWTALGWTQWRLHQWDKAQVSLERALRLDPNDFRAQFATLGLLRSQRQFDKVAALASLLKNSPAIQELLESVQKDTKERRRNKLLAERFIARGFPQRTLGFPSADKLFLSGALLLLAIGLYSIGIFKSFIFLLLLLGFWLIYRYLP